MLEEEWVVYRYTSENSPFKGQLDYETRADWDKWLADLHEKGDHNLYYELVATGLSYEQAKQFVKLSGD